MAKTIAEQRVQIIRGKNKDYQDFWGQKELLLLVFKYLYVNGASPPAASLLGQPPRFTSSLIYPSLPPTYLPFCLQRIAKDGILIFKKHN